MLGLALAYSVVLLTLSSVRAQDLSSANNVTSLEGTWSSGSGSVSTGSAFCNPANYSFTYPITTGISYSFTETGFFEEAQYRFTPNASNPNCITAYVLWQHGRYDLNSNGSITLYPFASDGRIQVQDPCAAVTNVITTYNQQTLYADWMIVLDSFKNNYALNLNRFDGAKMPPMYLIANPPNMLPTSVLTGANATGQTDIGSSGGSSTLSTRYKDEQTPRKRSAAGKLTVKGWLFGMSLGGISLVLAGISVL